MQPLALAKLSERNPERVAQQGEVEDLSLLMWWGDLHIR